MLKTLYNSESSHVSCIRDHFVNLAFDVQLHVVTPADNSSVILS